MIDWSLIITSGSSSNNNSSFNSGYNGNKSYNGNNFNQSPQKIGFILSAKGKSKLQPRQNALRVS